MQRYVFDDLQALLRFCIRITDFQIFVELLDKRAVETRINSLVAAFRTDDLKKRVKSSNEEQYGQISTLLTRIVSAIDDSKKAQKQKFKAVAEKIKEGECASQLVLEEGEKGRSKRSIEDNKA